MLIEVPDPAKGEDVLYTDALGKRHKAQIAHVWGNSGLVNVVYTEGGYNMADTNVPMTDGQSRSVGRFWEREGIQDGEQ